MQTLSITPMINHSDHFNEKNFYLFYMIMEEKGMIIIKALLLRKYVLQPLVYDTVYILYSRMFKAGNSPL